MERLTMLQDFLIANAETISKEQLFNLDSWIVKRRYRGNEELSLPVPGDGVVTTTCNTVCCAVGWACLIPAFKEQGLWYAAEDDNVPVFNGNKGIRAISEFFGITLIEASWLFLPSNYGHLTGFPSKHEPLRVAERIMSLITLKEMEAIEREWS
jgi:hypothetical protein